MESGPALDSAGGTWVPAFYIGAHAAVAGYGLLTRDEGRDRAAVPRLRLITPGD